MTNETVLTRDLTKEEIAEFKQAFDMFDIDGGGEFTPIFASTIMVKMDHFYAVF